MSLRIAFLFALSTACGGLPESGFFTGALEGTDARIAVLVEDEAALVYLCGGASSLGRTRWLGGAIEGDRIALPGLNARVEGDRLVGTLRWRTIELERAFEINAGLYQSRAGACRTGVIVGSDSIQGVSCDADGRFQQVSPDAPVDRNGFMVQVGLQQLFVEPAHPE